MSWMFSYCNSLASLDVSNLDTSSVTSMSSMFYNCIDLTNIINLKGVTSVDETMKLLSDSKVPSNAKFYVLNETSKKIYEQAENYDTLFGTDRIVVYNTNPNMKGDVDGDNQITIIDVRLLLQKTINGSYSDSDLPVMDYNNDGKIDIIDVRLLLQKVVNS